MTRRDDYRDLYETEKAFRRDYKAARRQKNDDPFFNPAQEQLNKSLEEAEKKKQELQQQMNRGKQDAVDKQAQHAQDSEARIAGRTGAPGRGYFSQARRDSRKSGRAQQKADDQADRDFLKSQTGSQKADGSKKKSAKGFRGFVRRRRAMILGGSAIGVSGLMFSGFLLFGPAFGIVDMIGNIGDFEFGPTNEIRGRRQARLFADAVRGRAAVVEGQRTGRYKTRLARAWDDAQVRRIADRLIERGGVMEFDANLRDARGKYPNRVGGSATGDPIRRVPTSMGATADDVMDLMGPNNRLLTGADLPQGRLLAVSDALLDKAYPGKIVGAARRIYTRQYVNAVTGFRWGKLFVQDGPSKAISTFFKRVIGLDTFRVDNPNIPPTDPEVDEVYKSSLENIGEDLDNGKTPSTSIRANAGPVVARAAKAIGASTVVAGLAQISCLANELDDQEVLKAYRKWSSTLRTAALMLSLREELMLSGFNDAEELGDLENELHSRRDIKVDDQGSVSDTTVSSSDFAGHQRSINAEVVDGEELEAQNYVDYDEGRGNIVQSMLGGIIGAFGVINVPSGVCDFLGNWFVDALLGIGECIITATIGCVAAEAFFFIFGPQIMAAALGLGLQTSLGIIATTPAQHAAVFAQGASIINSMESIGGAPVTNDEYNLLVENYLEQRQLENQELPFAERYFAISTPGSLMQKLASWREDILNSSILENVMAFIKAPFTLIGKIFSWPVDAQTPKTCLSQKDPRVIEAGGGCVPIDNFNQQKYNWDVVLDYCSAKIRLLDGTLIDGSPNPSSISYTVVDDVAPLGDFSLDSFSYDSYWIENTVLSISSYDEDPDGSLTYEFVDPGTGDTIRMTDDCLRTSNNAQYMKQIGAICHGLFLNDPLGNSDDQAFEPVMDVSQAYPPQSDPEIFTVDEAESRNELYQTLCIDSVAQNLGLWVLMGRYVDDIKLQGGVVGITNPGELTEVPDLVAIETGTPEEIAQLILAQDNIQYANADVRTSIEQVAEDGSAAIVTTDNPEETVVDRDILALILNVAQAFPTDIIQLGALTTGNHEPNSPHYQGKAVTIANEVIADKVLPYIYVNRVALFVDQLIFNPMPSGTATLNNGDDFEYTDDILNQYTNEIFMSVN